MLSIRRLLAAALAVLAAGGAGASAAATAGHAKPGGGVVRCRPHACKPKPKPKPKPAPPAPPPWQVGYYTGTTSQQAPVVVSLTVTGGAARVAFSGWVGETCDGSNILTVSDVPLPVPVAADGSFDAESSSGSVRGAFDTAGGVTGTLRHSDAISAGSCSSGDISFTARFAGTTPPPRPATPADGRYAGLSSQGEQILVDVVQGGRYVDKITWSVDEACTGGNGGGLFYNAAEIGGTWILGNVFVDNDSWTESDGVTSTLTIQGTFDASGGLSGTLQITTSGLGYSCSATVPWTAHLQ